MSTVMHFINEPQTLIIKYGSIQTTGWNNGEIKNKMHYSQVLIGEDILAVSEYEKYDILVQRARVRLQRAAGNGEWEALPALRRELLNAITWRDRHENDTRSIIERHEKQHTLMLAQNKYNSAALAMGEHIKSYLHWLPLDELFIGDVTESHLFLDGRWHVLNLTHHPVFPKMMLLSIQCDTIPSLFFKRTIDIYSKPIVKEYKEMLVLGKKYKRLLNKEIKNA